MNKKKIELNLEEVKWSDIRDDLYKINPELTQKCDYIHMYNKCPIFKVKYPYGLLIVKNGEFFLPTLDRQLISIQNTRIPETLRQSLTYASLPLTCIINNSSEVFIKAKDRIMPLNFLKTGELFGLFELMSLFTQIPIPNKPIGWYISAGARSVFMLPSISNTIGHRNICRKYNITDDVNNQHWPILRDISNNHKNYIWDTTILVFSNKWFENQNNIAYFEFYRYLVSKCFEQLYLFKELTEYNNLWLLFTHAINKRSLKPRTYIMDTIKHLIAIMQGLGIAFEPAINNTALPIDLIQQIYIQDYNLKHYIPNIMQPVKFTKGNKIYYSLSMPTIPNSSPYCNNPPSIIEDQRNIKNLLDILMDISHNKKNILNTSLENIKLEYFHSNKDESYQINSSTMIPENDSRFFSYNNSYGDNRVFCGSSSFFKGCIRIS